MEFKDFPKEFQIMPYYKDLDEVPHTGGEVYIYRIEGSVKGAWYCRIKRNNAKGYFRKTLKTTDWHEAMKRANRYWITVREAEEQNVVLAPKNNFRSLMAEWFNHRERTTVNSVARRVIQYQFRNYYEPYFGGYNVGNITERAYIKYLNTHRLHKDKCPAMRKKPTWRTLEVEQQNLRSFLVWCFREGKMRVRPDMRSVLKNPNWVNDIDLIDHDKPQRREMVSTEVYDAFRRYFRNVQTKRVSEARSDSYESNYNKISRRRMHFYILTIYNFVCRAGEEVLNLKFKDFTAHQSKMQGDSYYMSMTTIYGKKVKRRKVNSPKELVYYSDYNYFGYFGTWVQFLQEHGFPTTPDSYVFPVVKRKSRSEYHKKYKSYDQYEGEYKPYDSQSAARMIRDMRPKVKAWLAKNGRLTDRLSAEIDMFSAYSVRHIAIRNLIAESDYDFHRVAERANTGTRMIEQFYYKYGAKPEDRLVARHPTPSKKNTERYDDEQIENVAEAINIVDYKKKKGRSK